MNSHQLLQKEMEQEQGFPVLPADISCLLKTLNNDEIGYTQLASELEKFPSIVIKIIATANSAWASPVNPITTLRDSCARIGVPAVRSISIALSIAEVFDPSRCSPFDPKIFWVSALLTAEAAYICAKDNPDICPNTARLAGLLHNIGLLWLATQKPAETASIISLKNNNEIESISEGFTEELGVNLYTTGSYLASCINLPNVIVAAIASPAVPSNDEDPLITNHRNAQNLAASVLFGFEQQSEQQSEQQDKKTNKLNDTPCFEQLSDKLPGIQTLAQALFFS
ncbi:hypothetical protein MNBD_GAMMA06-1939 [hydrothermal vent metagenome]|uniref:HDOD domain-containing protein n=1 Tax=hydrothermal vent metagenome TaxID=652676 RepID=A0A3B0XAT9_9ZZZZ